jgi:hypothetical protein
MLGVITSFSAGLLVGLMLLAFIAKRQVGKAVPVFFDERQYKRIQKDLDRSFEKMKASWGSE